MSSIVIDGNHVLVLIVVASLIVGFFLNHFLSPFLNMKRPTEDDYDVTQPRKHKAGVRDMLGTRIVFWSTIAITVIALVILISSLSFTNVKDRVETTRWVFSSLLPLLGTWVGTVLAFYFSKENFQAASDATRDLVKLSQQRLSEVFVSEVMIDIRDTLGTIKVVDNELGKVKLSDIVVSFEKKLNSGRPVPRILFLGSNAACLGVLHRATWIEMQLQGMELKTKINLKTDKLEKLLLLKAQSWPDAIFKNYVEDMMAFVSERGTLADAKSKMEAIDGCNNVIVTPDGRHDGKTVGWITDVEISRVQQPYK